MNTANELSPIFIGGMFKSGTSLLRAMIGNHSMVASGLETYWFDIDWQSLDDKKNQERFRIIKEFYELDEATHRDMLEQSDCAEAYISEVLQRWCELKGKKRWAEKTPGNVIHIDRIRKYWQHAIIIHIIRDPRDIFASLREAKKWDDVDSFMERWSNVFNSVNRFKQSDYFNEDIFLEIKYEDLVIYPENVMEGICDFVGLDFESGMAKFDGKKEDFEKVKKTTGKESTTLARLAKPMTKSRLGIWKTILQSNDLDNLTAAAEKKGLADVYKEVCS